VKLSVIDQSPVSSGFTPADALRNTIDLARLTDRLGYHRYWIAEHHAIPALASPAPEILIDRVAAETSTIRVGSGAVLLPHYSPLKVVETFRVLHALYPGRIDLGLGRAPGGTPLDTYALRRDRDGDQQLGDDFPKQLIELLTFLHGGFPPTHPFSRIIVTPAMPGAPDVWLLGSSMWSASAAAQLGLPYAFAHFIDQLPTRPAIEHYRSHFIPSNGSEPRIILSLGVICADTDEEADWLAGSARLFRRRIRQGDIRPIPTPEEALAELGPRTAEPTPETGEFPRYVIGSPERVRTQLIDMGSQLGVDEMMAVTIVHDHRARLRSYELLAAAFDLPRRP
jgi:luciferase family oxidoreductase group 1